MQRSIKIKKERIGPKGKKTERHELPYTEMVKIWDYQTPHSVLITYLPNSPMDLNEQF